MVFEFSQIIQKYPLGKKVEIRRDECTEWCTIAGYSLSNGKWYINTEECGTFLLSRLMMIEVKRKAPLTVKGVLEDLKNNICIKYCRFPQCYENEEDLTGNHCFDCPLYCLEKKGVLVKGINVDELIPWKKQ